MAKLDTALSETSDVRNLPQEQRRALALDAANALPADEKAAVAREISLPDAQVTNVIWVILVAAVALVLVGSAFSMAWVYIQTGKLDAGAMLTVFTTVMGFVAGLLIKSPVSR